MEGGGGAVAPSRPKKRVRRKKVEAPAAPVAAAAAAAAAAAGEPPRLVVGSVLRRAAVDIDRSHFEDCVGSVLEGDLQILGHVSSFVGEQGCKEVVEVRWDTGPVSRLTVEDASRFVVAQPSCSSSSSSALRLGECLRGDVARLHGEEYARYEYGDAWDRGVTVLGRIVKLCTTALDADDGKWVEVLWDAPLDASGNFPNVNWLCSRAYARDCLRLRQSGFVPGRLLRLSSRELTEAEEEERALVRRLQREESALALPPTTAPEDDRQQEDDDDDGTPLARFDHVARRFGFDAREYLELGYTVLSGGSLMSRAVAAALGAARRLRAARGEWVSYSAAQGDKRLLFGLLGHYRPLLEALCGGAVVLPGANTAARGSPGEANSAQIAWRAPGSRVVRFHIDNPNKLHYDGAPQQNATLNLGVVLQGETADRDDAGNILVVPRSHNLLAEAFRNHHPCRRCSRAQDEHQAAGKGKSSSWRETEIVSYHGQPESMAGHYLGPQQCPDPIALRAAPGEAYIIHHQTLHGTAPNNTQTDRVVVYFRIRAAGRAPGHKNRLMAAMLDPTLETPLLRDLAALQQQQQQKEAAEEGQEPTPFINR